VQEALSDQNYPIDVVTAAAATMYRGTVRPDAKTKLERARRAMED
jgi:hypothetical protein